MKTLNFRNPSRGPFLPGVVKENITNTFGVAGIFNVPALRAMHALLVRPLHHAELAEVIFGSNVKSLLAELRGLGLEVPCRWTGERGRMTRRYGFNVYDREKARFWLFIESKKLIGTVFKDERGVIDVDKDPVIFAEVQAHVMALGGTLDKIYIDGIEVFKLSYHGLEFASHYIERILIAMGGVEASWC